MQPRQRRRLRCRLGFHRWTPLYLLPLAALYDVAYFKGWLWEPTLTPLEQIGPQLGVLIGYLWGRTS